MREEQEVTFSIRTLGVFTPIVKLAIKMADALRDRKTAWIEI